MNNRVVDLDSLKLVVPSSIDSLSDTLNIDFIKINPYIHVGDYLKGNVSGVLIQSPTAEPGSYQNIIVRGLSKPLFSNSDVNGNIAAVFVNGVPIALEHNFSSELQRYGFTKLGTGTDYLSSIYLSTIKSIEVIKDPVRLAQLGPLASNGAIWITTYEGLASDRLIGINTYYGFSTKPEVTPVNADFENRFRRQFYNRYRTTNDDYEVRYPGYLSDSTNQNYYGPATWRDAYYSSAPLANVDLNIRGGTERANFAFFGGFNRNAISSDQLGINSYNILFNVNMLPYEWLSVNTFINARRSDRDRNKNVRDRLTEMSYYPDLSTPVSPNGTLYESFLAKYDREVVDKNINNNFQGSIKITADLYKGLKFSTSFKVDYNEGRRDLFYPKELMETINYQSAFFSYSQRYILSNYLSYETQFDDNQLSLSFGTDYQEDLYRYYYARAFDGPNNYIKINVVEGDPEKGDYLSPKGGLRVLRWNNKEQFHMQSFFGSLSYAYKNLLDIKGLIRWDGSSTIQRDNRWILSPAVSMQYNLDNQFESEDKFKLRASYAKIGIPNYDSRYAMGPQYSSSSLAWDEEPTISTYFGYAGLSRNYKNGWIGYDMTWAYSQKYELAMEKSFFNSRLDFSLATYLVQDRNQIVRIPVPGEYGYSSELRNGLAVKNLGLDFSVIGKVLETKDDKFGWTLGLNLNINKNELESLPNNLQELVVGDRILKIGKPIDSYWLYQNNGIYNSINEIPTKNNSLLSIDGLPFSAGDAIWEDLNDDGIIDSKDKVIEGRSTPKFFGGFNNTFSYKKFQLDVGLTFALGQKALNQRASNRFNFINNESSNSIYGVKEIFQWQQDLDLSKYPIYNVWSNTNPYRLDQNLFLEDASYLKVRSLSLGYDLSDLSSIKSLIKTVRRAYVYVNANNLLTLTSFSGSDPELINFNGLYDGYGMQLSKSITLGIKLDL
ncbi:SusC/RagA family TonB-linked outer membrane protein [Sphingobacterium bovistauri]|uniref:SusC/RagA family TonB-linked outer membrane protein n=1 Tax=Sphingobacterium bovistauri TaxID=2781959 RepID=A0ABS7Z6V3_9SPHI|nr:SusC/RagA family TonB-linked outer membrane protein [Sphingobacterium bovistauri]MCA5005918.1 SusC/RagA family TonB-linked outer membrane protein [Sphingobacterium bovistauri]